MSFLAQFVPGDPMFSDGVDGTDVVVVLIKVLVAFAFLLVSVMLYIWGMRKVLADMQNRVGPARAQRDRLATERR